MIVVADTGPLNYLVQLKIVDVLNSLHGTVLIPPEVLTELRNPEAPDKVRLWAERLPAWLLVSSAKVGTAKQVEGLDSGETAAISLALSVKADALLLDERKARRVATENFGLRVTGTLGTIRDAHRAGLLNGYEMFEKLCSETNFRISKSLRGTFLDLLRSE